MIGLYSSVPQSGKSKIAEYLVEKYGFVRMSFADPLKAMLRGLLEYLDMNDHTIDQYLYGEMKEAVVPVVNASARHLMQTLGTEWGRKSVGEDLWVRILDDEVTCHRWPYNFVIDDMRFPNEANYIKGTGGKVVWVRRQVSQQEQHVSEGQLDSIEFDWVLENNADIQALKNQVDEMMTGFGEGERGETPR